MSPSPTNWFNNWSVESDDVNFHTENTSFLTGSPFQDSYPFEAIFAEPHIHTPIAPPLQTHDDITYNIPSPSGLDFRPLQTVDDENHNTETPPPTLEVPPHATIDGETRKTETPPPTLEVPPHATIDGETRKTETPPPTLEVPPLPTIDGETRKTETPPPTQEVPPLPTIDGDQTHTPLPTLEVALLQPVEDETNNTPPPPPPPPMVSSMQAIVPYETNEDSITADQPIVPYEGPSAGAITRKRGRPPGSKNSNRPKKKEKPYDPNSKVVKSCPSFDSEISEAERETGNKEIVDSVLMRFDAVRRRLCQLKCGQAILTTAFSNCKNLGVTTNTKKRIGSVPGVHVGDIFYSWAEMNLVGLHMMTVAGIDYMTIKDGATEGPLATSVVTSGRYSDKTEDDLQTLIYTGHGEKTKDQTLEKGNFALEESKTKGNDVRVIRGEKHPSNNNKKIYIYDGLYTVLDSWTANGINGFKEFKYKLVRKPNQPDGYANWRKRMDNSRKGFILEDISNGAETLPVPLVNEFDENDDKERPQDFSYVNSSTCSGTMIVQNYKSTACISCQGLSCKDPTCPCVQRNGGELPYHDRILVCRKPMVYECGDTCPCPPDCHNRLIQSGLKIRVEVFKTEKCGWGLRSLEPIRAGTFICELVGMAKRVVEEDDAYVFNSSHIYNLFKWNYEPELVGEDCWDQVPEGYKLRWQVLVSSREYGNVSRFMNHSCSPNVMWQPVEFEDSRQPRARIAFFAMKHIPPLTELRYDYGMSCKTEEVGEDGRAIYKGKKMCHCGSVKCQGSFG